MNLKRNRRVKKKKDYIIVGVCSLFLLLTGIALYRSFALYEEKKELNIISGNVPDQDYDQMLSFYIEDENGNQIPRETMPEGTNWLIQVECDKGTIGE